MNPFLGILIFSAIETATVAVWLAILGVEIKPGTAVLATTVLFIGYVLEHIVAFNVGKGRPILSFPTRESTQLTLLGKDVPPA